MTTLGQDVDSGFFGRGKEPVPGAVPFCFDHPVTRQGSLTTTLEAVDGSDSTKTT